MRDLLFLRLESDDNISEQQVQWLVTTHTGKIEAVYMQPENISAIAQKYNNHDVVLIIPDTSVSYYLAEIPINEHKKRLQAVPYILEDQILSNVESLHFAIGPKVDGKKYIVATINKSKLHNIIESLQREFRITPKFILTDAMCLYSLENITNKDSTKIYLNKSHNLALFIDKQIVVSDLDNIGIILDQSKNDNYEIIKHGITNLAEYFPTNTRKINFSSEHNIDAWLPFLVQSWFKGHARKRFNLAAGMVKSRPNIRFHYLWRFTAASLAIALVLLYSHQYLDKKYYAPRKVELEALIKDQLMNVDINNTRLDLAEKELDKKIDDANKLILAERQKNQFQLLLSAFAEKFSQGMNIKKIVFEEKTLKLDFEMNKSSQKKSDEIKEYLTNKKISVKENVKDQGKNILISWVLTNNA